MNEPVAIPAASPLPRRSLQAVVQWGQRIVTVGEMHLSGFSR